MRPPAALSLLPALKPTTAEAYPRSCGPQAACVVMAEGQEPQPAMLQEPLAGEAADRA